MKFENVENKVYGITGEELWFSRSIAVHGILILHVFNDQDYILLTKRSNNCPDEVGKFANVSGYLDWNESIQDCLIREYYEETGLNLRELKEQNMQHFGDNEQPYFVDGRKDASRENVTLRFKMGFLVHSLPILSGSDEVSFCEWVPVHNVFNLFNQQQFAWNHEDVIKEVLNKYYKIPY